MRFLAAHGFRNAPALAGWYEYSGGPLTATLGLLQEFVADGVDGWELALDEIAEAPERFLDRLDRLGEVTAQLHNALGSDLGDPAFCPEEPSVEALALFDGDGGRGDRARLPLAARGRRAPRVRSPAAARRCASSSASSRTPARPGA